MDGICATALAVLTLRELGADVRWHLPSRFEEGYGVSGDTLTRLAEEGVGLLLTVDCGITAVEEVADARALGLEVIVTDHHRPGESLPDCPIVATRPSSYPFPELCGTGVVHKLAQALLGTGHEAVARHADLVALATIADVVPLVDENRSLAIAGLRALARTQKPGLRALMRSAHVDPAAIDATAVGFRLAPRINAAGRLCRPDIALELILTEDESEAFRLAGELETLNRDRQAVEERIVREATRLIESWPEPKRRRRGYVLWSEEWHEGVIGIVASRLVERFNRPVVLLARADGEWKGSGRSVASFDLHAALGACSEHLDRFGGHRAAAGLSLQAERLEAFAEAFAAHADRSSDDELQPLLHDAIVPARRSRSILPPSSTGWHRSVSATRMSNLLVPSCEAVDPGLVGEETPALPRPAPRSRCRQRDRLRPGGQLDRLRRETRYDLVFRLKENRWNGTVAPQLVVRRLLTRRKVTRAARPARALARGRGRVDAGGAGDLPELELSARRKRQLERRRSARCSSGGTRYRAPPGETRARRGRVVRHAPALAQLGEGGKPAGLAVPLTASEHGRVVRGARVRSCARGGGRKSPQYTWKVAVVGAETQYQDLVEELLADVETYNPDVDRDLLARAFRTAAKAHEGQQRRSGEDFIHHPFGVAKICAQLRLDEQTIAAALLHDVVEDTEADLEAVRAEFGDEVAQLVEGVTKLTRIQFASREQGGRELPQDDRRDGAGRPRHPDQARRPAAQHARSSTSAGRKVQKAKETLEIYAPLAHRLGIHTIKWELEDLSFETLHPRKYSEIRAMVTERRADREQQVHAAGEILSRELTKVDIPADIAGRAKHFYSIYDKMAKKGREFNEIYDLTAMRVIVERSGDEGTRDCYGALGLIHSLWRPMPGRFKDFSALQKINRHRSLHTTVSGPEGRPLEMQVRTRELHEEAEVGVAAHWLYKRGKLAGKTDDEWLSWVKTLMDWQADETDPREFMKTFRTDLFDDEVYVFTPKGEVKTLPAGSTPIDFAYAVHTDVGHRTVGAKVNGRIVPLHYKLKNGDFVEILTSKSGRGPSRDWMGLAASSRARNKIRQWFQRETRGETEHKGREILDHALKAQNLPYRKLQGSSVLAQVIRETGFKKAEDFYVALGSGKLQSGQIVNKVLQRLKTDHVAEPIVSPKVARPKRTVAGGRSACSCPGSRTCSCAWRSAARRCRATRSSATSRSAAGSRSTAATVRT